VPIKAEERAHTARLDASEG